MKDIHLLFDEAGKLHGHYCPGLAIGVRAAVEAERILGCDCKTNKDLFCIYEKAACWLDGIQWVFNTSLGKGNIIANIQGEAAFNFYDAQTGKSVRLRYKSPDKGLNRPEMAEYILTGPFDELYEQGDVKFPCPSRG